MTDLSLEVLRAEHGALAAPGTVTFQDDEAEQIAIEGQRPLEIGDLEPDATDMCGVRQAVGGRRNAGS